MPTINKTNVEKDDKIKELEKKNQDLEDKLNQLIELMTTKNSENTENKINEKIEQTNLIEYEEPSPNKQVRVMSLCYGSLNLAESKGEKARLKFSKYGEIRPCLYSVLMNIVNNNRNFAEKGYFYILDKSVVYHLGLEEEYKKIVNNDCINNICNYNTPEIKDIVSVMNNEQKETMIRLLCDKIYNGETVDYNKIETISKYSNINIQAKVDEMRKLTQSVKQ